MNFISIDARQALADIDNPSNGLVVRATAAADLVTALIDWLNDLELDPDLEPSWGYDADGDPLDDPWTGEGDGDADAEPSLGAPEIPPTSLRRGGPHGWYSVQGSQEHWANGTGQMEEENAEAEDAGGGDINDEPHDGDLDMREGDPLEDMEPSAGFDMGEATMTTEWTPERPVEEVVHGNEYTDPAARITARRKKLRRSGIGHQGRFHGLVLKSLPERYRMVAEGDCLAPEIPNGACLEFSTTEPPQHGDFVAIYRRAHHVGPGEWQVVVKKFITDWRGGDVTPVILRDGRPISVGPCVEVAMLNPPKRLYYPAEHIEAIHKVVRIVPDAERDDRQSSASELLASIPRRT